MDRETEIRAAIASALEDLDGDRTPLDLVEEIPLVEAAVDDVIAQRISAARGQGLSWEAIASRLGISRQAAHKRFEKGKKSATKKGRGARIDLRLERSKRTR